MCIHVCIYQYTQATYNFMLPNTLNDKSDTPANTNIRSAYGQNDPAMQSSILDPSETSLMQYYAQHLLLLVPVHLWRITCISRNC